MVGVAVPVFTDEHIDPRVAQALIRRGYDVLSCQAAGRASQRISDDEQLAYAAQHGRALFTFNVVDFIALDVEWKRSNRTHAGIIVSPEIRTLSELVRRLEFHLQAVTAEQHADTLLRLSGPAPSSTR